MDKCESGINPDCTGQGVHTLPDKRKVCAPCRKCITDNPVVETERVPTAPTQTGSLRWD